MVHHFFGSGSFGIVRLPVRKSASFAFVSTVLLKTAFRSPLTIIPRRTQLYHIVVDGQGTRLVVSPQADTRRVVNPVETGDAALRQGASRVHGGSIAAGTACL
jgi:hypothetical protein